MITIPDQDCAVTYEWRTCSSYCRNTIQKQNEWKAFAMIFPILGSFGAGVQAHSQKFWFVEIPGKIPENLGTFPEYPGKIPKYLGKKCRPTLFDFKKWCPTFAEKLWRPFFVEGHTEKGLQNLCGRKCVDKSLQRFRQVRGNSYKNPSHPQKFAFYYATPMLRWIISWKTISYLHNKFTLGLAYCYKLYLTPLLKVKFSIKCLTAFHIFRYWAADVKKKTWIPIGQDMKIKLWDCSTEAAGWTPKSIVNGPTS